jgi:hypothetical protein
MSEVDEMRARLDRLESLVGTAYADDGTVVPALEAAVDRQDGETVRSEVRNVIQFLRDNNPNR